MASKHRATLELDERTYEALGQTRALMGAASDAEVIRRAIRVFSTLVQKTHEGGSVRVVLPDGSVQDLLIL